MEAAQPTCLNNRCGAPVPPGAAACPRCQTPVIPVALPYHDSTPPPRTMVIGASRTRAVRGLLAYLAFFAVIVAVLVYLFIELSGSLKLSLVAVVFMVGYMVIMGYLAGRKIDSGQ